MAKAAQVIQMPEGPGWGTVGKLAHDKKGTTKDNLPDNYPARSRYKTEDGPNQEDGRSR